jgi:predicted TIM-barrel fold metal-dependent hydrolase
VRYSQIEKEIDGALKLYDIHIATPLFWFIPDYIKQGVTIESVMKNIPYGGFKLHPYNDKWTFAEDKKQNEVLHTIFHYAGENDLPILIHTGESGVDSPDRFEKFFEEYPAARVILAHGRPIDKTIEMMRRFDNVECDTAFMSEESVHALVSAGLASRVLLGSDFPITQYMENRNNHTDITLPEQYKKDIAVLQKYEHIKGVV